MARNVHEIGELPVTWNLYESIQRGNAQLDNVKGIMAPTWKSRTRARGGFWTAECEWNDIPSEQEIMFQEGLMREIRASVGGMAVWEGFAAEMELKRHGESFTRWWGDIHNRVKCIYTRLAENKLTNGSAETSAWASYGTPTTNEQSEAWKTHGTYSDHIITDASNEGATIQTGISIVAGKHYDCQAQVNVIAGTFKLQIYREDTGASLGSTMQSAPAQSQMWATIAEDNSYSGTVGIRIFTTTASGEMYADDVTFREGPVQAETSYYEDADSQAEYGVIEEALLEAGLSDETANGKAQTKLTESAWPRAHPPDEGAVTGKDGLSIVWYGHVFTLRNQYALNVGPDPASDIITAAIGESQYITAGAIEANSMEYQGDDRGPLRLWEIIRDVTMAGDASGNRWECGVYENRLFKYQQAANVLTGRWRGGRLWNMAGGVREAWYARPGPVNMDNMPLGPPDLSGLYADNPRVAFIEELEFDVADWLKTGGGLHFRRTVSED